MFINNLICYLINSDLLADYTRESTKIIKICQSNSLKLDKIIATQERLEKRIENQDSEISKIMSMLKDYEKTRTEMIEMTKGKGKAKVKKEDDFYQVNKYQ